MALLTISVSKLRTLQLFFTCIFVILHSISSQTLSPTSSTFNSISKELFIDKLVNTYGTNGYVNVGQLDKLFTSVKEVIKASNERETSTETADESQSFTAAETVSYGNASEICSFNTNSTKCWTTKCLSSGEIFKFHGVPSDGQVDHAALRGMLPTIVYQLQNPSCRHDDDTEAVNSKPQVYEVWGYSFICVTLINLCALTGVLFLPLMKKSIYQRLLVFMVALAVGTLAGSGLLFLIPDAFELSEETTHEYIYKATTIMGGIYLFFLLERVMKIIAEWRKRASNGEDGVDINDVPVFSVIGKTTVDNDPNFKMSFKVPDSSSHGHGHSHGVLSISESSTKLVKANGLPQDGDEGDRTNENDLKNGDVMVVTPKKEPPEVPHTTAIKSVAWMVIFGDGVHNFIDGLSIGAAFTINTMTGFSVAVAVICEELPHELGDFAILLNSGMTMRQALSYNFLSACMCYLGLVFGIIAGETSSGATWIFALAGGMFLYISLVDMLPEVNHAAEEEAKNVKSQVKLLLVQNMGMLLGFGIMLVFAIYGEKIVFV